MGQIEEFMRGVPGAQQMLSTPSIGLITVAGFIAETGDLSQYTSWQQLRKLAGLNLKENSSGKHKGQTKISQSEGVHGCGPYSTIVYLSWWQIIHSSGRYISISRPVWITRSNPSNRSLH